MEQPPQQRLAPGGAPKLFLGGKSYHTKPPGFEGGRAIGRGCSLQHFQVGVLKHILRPGAVAAAAMKRPSEGIRVQGSKGGGEFVVHSFAAE